MLQTCRPHLLKNMSALKAAEEVRRGRGVQNPTQEKTLMTIRRLVLLAVLMLLLTGFGFGQGVATGDLHVTVKDPGGNLVTNAAVTVRDQAKGLERSTTANTIWRVPRCAPAARELHGIGSSQGFRQC